MNTAVAPRFIAEVSSNHNQDLDRCRAFIDCAADLGCYAVKFQLFRIEQLFSPEVLARSEAHRRRKAWELPAAFIPELAVRCRLKGIQFCCTPFDLHAVEILKPHVDLYKIASYELLWDALLRACGGSGKPVVLSTGMADMTEVGHAVSVLRQTDCKDWSLLHCSSAYPAPPEHCNLAAIETMRKAFVCNVGWSDHSHHPGVVIRAVHRWQAHLVEFHLDLDREGAEYQTGHCWLPEEIRPVIQAATLGAAADGDGIKQPNPAEQPDRNWRADPSDGLRPLKSER
ncbi:N-acetylneuraminate synthase family protein [Acanthopleuribacter pedis]|uniref:N-acetylneuraminate synthase family protein n=1 Tax=Acanthopleuribacter pedis TaxID=442870 RepID=A0A8J7U1X2_9BACT|nr:N-acetylneuraminate synthase family protein [Acanthopleuribacter pedis]MBO1317987.1 N-acetylneuraminate synthase family protein [Acanthopleuribacter pedis]